MRYSGNSRRRPGVGAGNGNSGEWRVQARVVLNHLTAEDGRWLAPLVTALLRRARPQAGAVSVEDVMLRYRPGRLSVADALDATAQLLEPFAAAGADVEHRGEWYLADDDGDDDGDDDAGAPRIPPPGSLFQPREMDEEDLLVSARVVVDARADDVGAAALYWAALALAARES